ncbi:lipid IV(A) 3-deoxy-D-manno-octulosonic acid transferase [Denitrificimonas sp. JX-1]|uniref:3-deoxy-D-manno-octulosonic acid transferase n=1 Tax=Denitrificimonas halotolerans TaxID=3098930 RepID=A0ABU5GU68_9GAMM|nr:lipid IV(A) 3-deoxy-D-manno-octulosonic acid transferase [Denitrificimonas sp. JX-1]MDY7219900.1 lipid IV(A) 3-deoxy-D-manno-octulosonic acid transferase [Denitrificimonas sp. JX-1]
MNRTLYTVLLYLGVPLIFIRLWLRSRKASAYGQRINERFALNLPELQQGGIWLHAVSVGESIAAAPVIKALQQQYPDLPITVTCMTPTGSERIQSLFGDSVQHCYLPYDLPCASKRFFQRLRPRLGIVMETELWPNHIHQCAQFNIPVLLANGRLSERSARGYGRFPKLVAPMLAQLSGLAVQTEVEAQRFIELGARPTAVSVTGSIKYDLQVSAELPAQARTLREQWHASARPVWIAASTHEGEDAVVLAAHQQLLQQFPNALLILVPRHPERFSSVYALCMEQGMSVQRRSTHAPVHTEHQVLLGDTMGELMFLYALADVALVGGSLIEHGGHNMLEPVALAKPTLTGPHYFNFLDIARQLSEAGGLQEVADASELTDAVAQLWSHPAQAERMCQAGQQVLSRNQGALQRLLDMIEKQLEIKF